MEKWFKFYSADYLIDGKIHRLSPCQRSCWVSLLCLADMSDMPGEIKNIDEEELMELSGIDRTRDEWDETKGVLAKLEVLEMLKRKDNGMITILNFRKRQGTALTNYERLKKHREMKRNETLVTNDNVNDNTRREENRKEFKPANKIRKEPKAINPKILNEYPHLKNYIKK